MPTDLDNIDCWHCGKEIPGALARRSCHLCAAANPEEMPWGHVTSFKWRRLFRRLTIGATMLLVVSGIFTLARLLLR